MTDATPTPSLTGLKLLVAVGAAMTLSDAVATLPGPSDEGIALVLLVATPEMPPARTSTLNTQLPLVAMVAPLKLITLVFAFATRLLVPPHTELVPTPVPEVATCIWAGRDGRLSTRAPTVIATVLGLVMLKVKREVPLGTTGFGLNTLLTKGRPTDSVLVAAVAELPALVVVTAPEARVLLKAPLVAVALTLTLTVHEPLAGMVPLESATEVPPLAAVTIPPAQVVAPLAGVALA